MEEETFSLKGVNVHFTFEEAEQITITISSGDDFFDFTVDLYELMDMRYEKGIDQEYSSADFENPYEFLKMINRILGNRLSYKEFMQKYFPNGIKDLSIYEKYLSIVCPDCKKLILEEK